MVRRLTNIAAHIKAHETSAEMDRHSFRGPVADDPKTAKVNSIAMGISRGNLPTE